MPVFLFNLNNSAINEDILEIIELYILHNYSNKNNDKQKLKQYVQLLFYVFLKQKPPKDIKAQNKISLDSALVEKIDAIERKLFKQNFSYSKCVKEKIEGKNSERELGKQTVKSEADDECDLKVEEKDKLNEGSDKKDEEEDENGADEDYYKKGDELDEPKPQKEKNGTAGKEANEDQDLDDIDEASDNDNADDGDSFDKMINDCKSNDSSKDFHTKPMVYKSQQDINEEAENPNSFVQLIPIPGKNSKVFFGGNQFYICLRFYYTLFERFLKAFEFANQIPENEDTLFMSAEEKKRLGQERYENFKDILKLYLKEGFDPSIFEDCLRCLYGRDASFLFSIDKIIGNIIKNIPSDDLSLFVFENKVFKDPSSEEDPDTTPEYIKYCTISQKMR